MTVTIQQPQYSVLIGGTVTLGCTVSGSPSATNVYWQRTQNGVVTTINSNTNTNKYSGSTTTTPSLTISGADQNDEATYVCFATNVVGTAQSSQTFLDVTGSKFTVKKLFFKGLYNCHKTEKSYFHDASKFNDLQCTVDQFFIVANNFYGLISVFIIAVVYFGNFSNSS